jgi:hypothetical protein
MTQRSISPTTLQHQETAGPDRFGSRTPSGAAEPNLSRQNGAKNGPFCLGVFGSMKPSVVGDTLIEGL